MLPESQSQATTLVLGNIYRYSKHFESSEYLSLIIFLLLSSSLYLNQSLSYLMVIYHFVVLAQPHLRHVESA